MKKLALYKKKRRFENTPEPAGEKKSGVNKALTFVVQRHDASHLHFDFRLELNGVLKSWAIPKGPSLDPNDKRLAVMVEDHPVSYGKFEGVIPKGNYGAGTVEIWDQGTYEPENTGNGSAEKFLDRQLAKGSLKFTLHGNKLKGGFALVRLKNGKGNNWLLIKHRDEYAVDSEYNPDTKEKPSPKPFRPSRILKATDLTQKIKNFIEPMLARLHDKPFDDAGWIHEIKWDGYRAIAEVKDGDVQLYSRNGLSFAARYPEIFEALKDMKQTVTFDGEIVVMDKNNRPSFQKLQQRSEHPSLPICYYVFDCLSYQGKDIKGLPLLERKKIAETFIPKSEIIKYGDHVEGSGIAFFSKMVEMNMEGMISKRSNSIYTPGKRSGAWLKIKNHNTQEAVIAGYTAPRASRKYFGALILGIWDGQRLQYIGHTGTGFTEKTLKEIYNQLQPLIRKNSPFDTKIPVNAEVTWVEPKWVCQVKFAEITDNGILRQAVFMGLRTDKSAKEANQLDITESMMTSAPRKSSKKKEKKAERLPQIKKESGGETVLVDGHSLTITNREKIYWPEEKITKGDLIYYYQSISKFILPYLKDRPQSLKRNPDGILDKGFFHKDAGESAPSWVKSKSIHSKSTNKDVHYILCNDAATLGYLNNLGCIEINPWHSTVRHLDKPDYLVIDIDPSDKNSFDEVIDAALAVKEILDKAGAVSYCKTSGASGMHVFVPLNAAHTYDQIGPFAQLIAVLAQQQLPALTTVERPLAKRKGRIYLDYLQNKEGQTIASAYSLRPVPGASVSAPLQWKEVRHGLSPLDFTIFSMKDRLKTKGDLFGGVLKDRIDLKKCLRKLETSK